MVDPHGDLVEKALAFVPENRQNDLIHFNVPDANLPIGFNPLQHMPPAERALAASDLIDVFKKIWAESGDGGWNTYFAMRFWRYWSSQKRRSPTCSACSPTGNFVAT